VRRPQVWKFGEQIVVRADPIARHLSVCEDSQEGISCIVGECPAIAREGRRAARVIGHYVWQQRSRHSPCLLRRIPTCVLQRVREDGNETGIVCRLTREVSISLRIADQKDGLRRQCAAIRRDPTCARAA
jgi:hypothetical protein